MKLEQTMWERELKDNELKDNYLEMTQVREVRELKSKKEQIL